MLRNAQALLSRYAVCGLWYATGQDSAVQVWCNAFWVEKQLAKLGWIHGVTRLLIIVMRKGICEICIMTIPWSTCPWSNQNNNNRYGFTCWGLGVWGGKSRSDSGYACILSDL